MALTAAFPDDATTELRGTIDRVVYANGDTGFCVVRLRLAGQRSLATVVGHALDPCVGEAVTARGTWIEDRRHGRQFRADTIVGASAADAAGLESCLAAGLVKGIGPRYARRLAERFGDALFEIAEREPLRLTDVPGIGPMRARRIGQCLSEQRSARDAARFLQDHGVGGSQAIRLFRRYGAETESLVREDPYRLVRDMPAIGFALADGVAMTFGVAPAAPIRTRSAFVHLLTEAAARGECGQPVPILLDDAQHLLRLRRAELEAALAEAVGRGDIVLDDADGQVCAFTPAMHADEDYIAARLRQLRGVLPWRPFDVEQAIRAAENALDTTFSAGQKRAIATALHSRVAVVTGGPGVGKTALIAGLLRILGDRGVRVLLTAPTGRAAKRLTEVTGQEARTLHRLLEYDSAGERFGRNGANPLDGELLIVDEMSMVDVPMLAALLRAMPEGMSLLLVGDTDQLPPIGAGQPLTDLLAAGTVSSVRITEVFRQPPGSRILASAHRIRTGLLPERALAGELSDFYVVPARTLSDAAAKIVAMVADRIPRRFGIPPEQVQVLCPVNEGPLGTRALNRLIRETLRSAANADAGRLRPGDRVMQVENDYDRDVYNGDLGTVTAVDPDGLNVCFGERSVRYDHERTAQLELAYAITIHKAQGSEYPAVIIPVVAEHGRMLDRNLIYTAVTRGRRLVVLVGTWSALETALGKVAPRRLSRLRDLLAA